MLLPIPRPHGFCTSPSPVSPKVIGGVSCRVSLPIDSCITQLKAQGPSRTCHESKEEDEKEKEEKEEEETDKEISRPPPHHIQGGAARIHLRSSTQRRNMRSCVRVEALIPAPIKLPHFVVDRNYRLLIVPLFRGSSIFESLILSHHSR